MLCCKMGHKRGRLRQEGSSGSCESGWQGVTQVDTCASQEILTLHGQKISVFYCSTNSNLSPSNSPLSLIFRLGITSSAMNEISMNGAFSVLPISREILLSRS